MKAMAQGNKDARVSLGEMNIWYADHFRVGDDEFQQSIPKAIRLYKMAADLGNISAQKRLGDLYRGEGIEHEAVKYYKMADDQEMANMMANMTLYDVPAMEAAADLPVDDYVSIDATDEIPEDAPEEEFDDDTEDDDDERGFQEEEYGEPDDAAERGYQEEEYGESDDEAVRGYEEEDYDESEDEVERAYQEDEYYGY